MENQNYRTTDLGEASTLLVLGFRFIGLDDLENRPGQKVFVFSKEQLPPDWYKREIGRTIEDIVKAYRNGIILVNAQDYFLAIKHLKSRIYNQINIKD